MVIFVQVFSRLAQRTTKRHAFSMAMLGASMTFPLLTFRLYQFPDQVEIPAQDLSPTLETPN